MSKTPIEWTDYSWNPVTGCTMGCKNCYARRLVNRFQKKWGYDFTPRLHPKRLVKHDNWPPGSKVFCCDMGDLFDPQAPFAWASQIVAECERHPEVTFQFLTKQVERMAQFAQAWYHYTETLPSNIWWGYTVRNQQEADERIPELLRLKDLRASVVYISAEPLLGAVDVTHWLSRDVRLESHARVLERGRFAGLDWIICGGETGPGARPMSWDWARSLRDQCIQAGVPFFYKQNGPQRIRFLEGREWHQFPNMEDAEK